MKRATEEIKAAKRELKKEAWWFETIKFCNN